MSKLDISQRGKASEMYGSVPLYSLIDSVYGHLSLPPMLLRVSAGDLFQEVMAWIDRVRCEADDDTVCRMLRGAWQMQWRYFADMAEQERLTPSDEELEALVCAVLQLVCDSLMSLGSEQVDGCWHYQRFARTLLGVLEEHASGRAHVLQALWATDAYRCYEVQLAEWLYGYVADGHPLYTAADGTLVLQENSVVLTPPKSTRDLRMYSEKAQRIWKKLIDEKWCERCGAGLAWKKDKLALGYLVQLVANVLEVKHVTNGNIAWDSFKDVFLDLQDASILSQARNGAKAIKKGSRSVSWPPDAQVLNTYLKMVK